MTIPLDHTEILNVLGAPLTVKSTFASSGQFILDHTVPPGYGVPPHVHADEDEAYLMLSGEVTFCLDGVEQIARPGAFVFAPRGHQHSFRNATGVTARMIVLCTPGKKLELFFRQLDAAARTGGIDETTVISLAAAHDITVG